MKKWKQWKVSVDRLEVVGQPKAGRDTKESTAKAQSILHEIETCTLLIHRLPLQLHLAASQRLFWIIHHASFFCPSDFLISLSLSLSIYPFREHQQRFCPGLHQRLSDSERPAGQRKPTLLSRIHSHCQGEPLNVRRGGGVGGTVTTQTSDRKSVSPVDQERALIW